MRRAWVVIEDGFPITVVLLLVWGSPILAQPMCTDINHTAHVGYNATSGTLMPMAANCGCGNVMGCACGDTCTTQSGYRCYQPKLSAVQISTSSPGCNPKAGPCAIRATVPVQWPGNSQSFMTLGSGGHTSWMDASSNQVGSCGGAGAEIYGDQGNAWIEVGNFSCGNPNATQFPGIYTLQAVQCTSPCMTPTASTTADLRIPSLVARFCAPPPDFCTEGGGASGGGSGSGAGSGGGGAGGGAASGRRMADSGSKGNGPDSGAAGTTGGGSCQTCQQLGSSSGDGSGCGFSVAGGGSSCFFAGAGAHIRYGAGGVGGQGFPGSSGTGAVNPWNTTLGRYWSHDYAERIVMDPTEAHVWLLTRFGSFREFGGLQAGGGLRAYQTVTPSDEYRTLYYDTASQGWQLKGLDGSVEYFLGKNAGSPAGMLAGFLDRIVDRLFDPVAHPAVQAAYNASNQLDHVIFPDGRQETFGYASGSSGKLTSITELGTDGTNRTWTLAWSGDDLTAIQRPDVCSGPGIGSSWNFTYDSTHPQSYVAQVLLQDCLHNGRVEAEFQYDPSGNVIRAWRGDPSYSQPAATNAYQLSFDAPASPAVTTLQTLIKRVTGNPDTVQTDTFLLDRDPGRSQGQQSPVSRKARVRQITGQCPSCGTVANPVFNFNDPANPLLPTTVTDGNNVSTGYTYDGNGRLTAKVETVQTSPTPQQRQTSWTYDGTFRSFVSTITGPFSPPGSPPAGTRTVGFSYDTKGNLTTRTISGREATYPTGAFNLTTAYGNYSAAGLPGFVNPPDTPSTMTDATTYTFKPGVTNGYLVATRSDPVVGAPPINAVTSFLYDGFNRQTDVTDPNGATTHTTYDPLNRVLTVTEGYGSSQPLTTTYSYSLLGDLACVQRPAGNAIAYVYDTAGRVISVARQASCNSPPPLERTVYTLDAAGHRIQDLRQRIVTGSPVTDATTSYSYSTTCHLDSMTAGDPNNASVQSTTQFAYDCNNNLASVWDANHNQPAAPSTTYVYDSLNRMVQMSQPWGGAGGGTAVTAYSYDLQDHLTTVTDPERNRTTYVTSDRDLPTSQVSPVSGTTTYVYNDHGQLVQQTDARGVMMTRQLDPADRLRLVAYSADPSLTTAYTYDATTVGGTFPVGRLSSIIKGTGPAAIPVNYTYDLFGRMLQDGNLGYAYDPNGNRASIAYPGSVTACYGYDIADRQVSLSYSTASGSNVCQGVTTPIVTSTPAAPTVYSSSGPLQVLHLANGITETHSFDQRYYPTSITAGTLSWGYNTDAVGNITAITPGRGFAYQDFQYFLTQANAPTMWGTRAWTYDTIGNRLSEDRGGGAQDIYHYLANGAQPAGDTPLLNSISLAGSAGTKFFTYDLAGNVIQEAAPASHLDLVTDSAGRLGRMAEGTRRATSTLLYDGRGFLATARSSLTDCGPLVTTATYGSGGLLYHRQQLSLFSGVAQAQTRIFYFAGRPVGQIDGPPVTSTLTYLSVDHLGTPILATGSSGTIWSGGFEPFGRDFTSPSAQDSGICLRLPGQWSDQAWSNSSNSGTYYNLKRWYDLSSGRYLSADPFGILPGPNQFAYTKANPVNNSDQLGLDTFDCKISLGGGRNPNTKCDFFLCHEFLCVIDSNNQVSCGGQGTAGDANWFVKIVKTVPGVDDPRAFNRKFCPRVDKRPCVDTCVKEFIAGDRPQYNDLNLFGAQNCQAWAAEVISMCQRRCDIGARTAFPMLGPWPSP
jgi:RHS repeat-associated protein